MRPTHVRPIHIAYGLLGFFFVIEPLLRQGKAAISRQVWLAYPATPGG